MTLTIAMVIGACTTGAAVTSAPAPMPVGVPAPVHASFAGGSRGYDSGAQVFAFSTQLPPIEATHAYAATLVAAGYTAVRVEGTWRYFRGATALVAFEVGTSGPPTDLLVRVMARDASVPQDLDPIAGNPGGHGRTPAPGTTHAGRTDAPSGGAGADLAARTPVPQPDPPHGSPNPRSQGNGKPDPGGNGKPDPGGNGKPDPGGNGKPDPGGSPTPSDSPTPRGNGNPNPGGNGNPNPGGNGNPKPGSHGH